MSTRRPGVHTPGPLALLRALPLLAAVTCFLLGDAVAMAQDVTKPVVQVARVDGTINLATARYLARAISSAERRRSEALVIELDTPGGFDTAMREMVQRMLRSSVPVVVYVSPSGARAGSAGVFITLAADVAAMAPGTNIGAAHPVSAGPGGAGQIPDPVMAGKVTNDAAAYARSLAQQRGRNADWAERAVRESESLPASEALRAKVVDEVATDLRDLLTKIDGRRLTGPWGDHPLRTREATIVDEPMNVLEQVLQWIVDPNIAYLLFTVGSYAIVAELYSPGAVVPAVVGSICLVLALIAFGSLPVNWGGLALLLLAVGMLIAEIKITSHGLLTVGSIVAFVLGSVMLFPAAGAGPFEVAAINPWLIAWLALASATLFGWILRKGLAARLRPALPLGPVAGDIALVERALAPVGTVRVRSEEWSARAPRPGPGVPIAAGEAVRVVGREGLTLLVEPLSVAPPEPPEAPAGAA